MHRISNVKEPPYKHDRVLKIHTSTYLSMNNMKHMVNGTSFHVMCVSSRSLSLWYYAQARDITFSFFGNVVSLGIEKNVLIL